jgi:deferrochelatase/peroxidase EfeB
MALTRRALLASLGAGGMAAAAGGGYALGREGESDAGGPGAREQIVAFHGRHQAGIATPAQDRLHFAALDVEDGVRASDLRELLRTWSQAAERMTAGRLVGDANGEALAPPQDTGEALGLTPAHLTVTFGLGPSLFDGRFGLAEDRPAPLRTLPALPGDELDPARSGGDLCVQACADDPQVAVHAIRNLSRIAFGRASLRWSQLGFGRTSSTSTAQATPRNMFGFKDGTNNVKAEEPEGLAQHVWVAPEDEQGAGAWMAGGSYLVARRIRMHIEVWDRTPLQEQEDIIGRDKKEGAPLGQAKEFDPLDFARKGPDGQPAIPVHAHVKLAHQSQLGGVRILRRGYNFTDGSDGVGHLDAGLFFIAFMRNPGKQFVPMQRALASKDVLNEYIEHNGSAVFACPPGLADGEHWGQALFA